MMETRINRCLERCRAEKRGALVVYVTVGCPSPAESEALIGRLIEAGADMIELGVPFSDPMADGPVIQRAGQLALQAGTTLPEILAIAGRIRKRFPETPLVLFSYYNVLLNYGLDRLGADLRSAGVDGLLAVDLPLEERGEVVPICEANGIQLIPLVSPATSPERAAKIAAGCSGFVYCITVRGVTGAAARAGGGTRECEKGVRTPGCGGLRHFDTGDGQRYFLSRRCGCRRQRDGQDAAGRRGGRRRIADRQHRCGTAAITAGERGPIRPGGRTR